MLPETAVSNAVVKLSSFAPGLLLGGGGGIGGGGGVFTISAPQGFLAADVNAPPVKTTPPVLLVEPKPDPVEILGIVGNGVEPPVRPVPPLDAGAPP